MSTTNSTIPKLTLDYYASLRLRYYINFGINTLATIAACFIVVRKSPEPMKTYKWFLLNIAVRVFMIFLKLLLDMVFSYGLEHDFVFHAFVLITGSGSLFSWIRQRNSRYLIFYYWHIPVFPHFNFDWMWNISCMRTLLPI